VEISGDRVARLQSLRAVSPEVVGRPEELAAIQHYLDTEPTAPTVLVLDGEAGIGKSTIWSAGVDDARRRRLQVLVSRPTQAERGLAFAGLGDLFEGIVDDVIASLTAPRRRAVEIALLVRHDPDPVDPRALGIAVRDVLIHLAAAGRLLIAIDDVQWVDEASAEALAFAIRRLTEPVQFLLARRIDEGGTHAVEEAFADECVERLCIGPLSLGATQAMLHSRLDRDFARPTMRRIHETSGGNPFYALEIARTLSPDVDPAQPLPLPGSLDDLMAARLARLPDETMFGLGIVAAAGDPSWELLATAGVDRAAVEPAITAGVLASCGRTARFSHPLLASAFYRRMTSGQRNEAHGVLARLVGEPVEQARHLAHSTLQPSAAIAEALDRAAETAAARGAIAVAAELREHALRLTPNDAGDDIFRRRLVLARAHLANTNVTRANELTAELLREATGTLRAEVLLMACDISFGDDHGVITLREALQHAAGDPMLEARLHARLGWDLRFTEGLGAAEPHSEASLELAERIGDADLLAVTLANVAGTRHHLGRPDGLILADRAYDLVVASDDPQLRADVACPLLTTYALTGRHDRLADLLEPYCVDSAERDELLALGALYALAFVEHVRGNFVRAAELIDRSHELVQLYDDRENLPISLWTVALVAAYRGELVTARQLTEEALELTRAANVPWLIPFHEGLLGTIASWSGAGAVACGHFEAAERANDAAGSREPTMARWRPDYVEALLAVRRRDEAVERLHTWEAAARRLDRTRQLAEFLRCRGLVAAANDDVADAERLLLDAATAHSETGDPFGQGRAMLGLGIVRRRARKKRAAREAIEHSVATFERCGADGWAAKARAELGTIGGRRRESDLTAAERRVATLAAEGLTNREVAATLFLGERTVVSHLSHVYAKLGVRSRTELARTLRAPG
jgi:DNA-binding CsgD family transcriptional regulator